MAAFPVLARRSTGTHVMRVQSWLNMSPPTNLSALSEDGNFGALTEARVMEFQATGNLMVDGIVGPETLGALVETVDQFHATARPFRLQLSMKGPPGAVANFDRGFLKIQCGNSREPLCA